MTDLLGGFEPHQVVHDGIPVNVRSAGSGPPVLLLHGYPETMLMWHRVAPVLAERFTVTLADLRGYGDSGNPPGDPAHETYAKRAMAGDMLAVMTELGHDRFAVVGHDRGGRVAHRMALDTPGRITAAAMLDIVPTRHMFGHVDLAMARSYFHWFFLIQGGDLPERLINADPETWVRSRFAGRHAGGVPFDESALAEYVQRFRDPRTVHATCEDYRAAATVDLRHDDADYASGNRIRTPVLALWGSRSYVGRNFDVARVWRDYADDVVGHVVDADHYLAEEAPERTSTVLLEFLEGARA